jgi:GTP-binding protein
MKLSDVVFNKSVALETHEVMFDEKSEVVFVGRSNVGKSSIMNALFEKKDMVKTSGRPGKTKTANIFVVANKYYMTDLPGYGFARLGQNMKEALDGLISWYLEERTTHIKKVVILIDSRIGAQQTDIDMYKYLLTLELPLTIVLSKTDKIKANELAKGITEARKVFFGQEIIPVSSLKKVWVKELAKSIRAALLS